MDWLQNFIDLFGSIAIGAMIVYGVIALLATFIYGVQL